VESLTWPDAFFLLVDLLTSYSKKSWLSDELAQTPHRLERVQSDSAKPPRLSVSSQQPPRLWRVRDRLSESDIQRLMTRYHEGVTGRELAQEFNVGMTNLKRLVREYGTRRKDRGGAA
jgi:hypothetical protein